MTGRAASTAIYYLLILTEGAQVAPGFEFEDLEYRDPPSGETRALGYGSA